MIESDDVFFDLRECIECEWIGNADECVWLGSIGPLCPRCHEVTESVEVAD